MEHTKTQKTQLAPSSSDPSSSSCPSINSQLEPSSDPDGSFSPCQARQNALPVAISAASSSSAILSSSSASPSSFSAISSSSSSSSPSSSSLSSSLPLKKEEVSTREGQDLPSNTSEASSLTPSDLPLQRSKPDSSLQAPSKSPSKEAPSPDKASIPAIPASRGTPSKGKAIAQETSAVATEKKQRQKEGQKQPRLKQRPVGTVTKAGSSGATTGKATGKVSTGGKKVLVRRKGVAKKPVKSSSLSKTSGGRPVMKKKRLVARKDQDRPKPSAKSKTGDGGTHTSAAAAHALAAAEQHQHLERSASSPAKRSHLLKGTGAGGGATRSPRRPVHHAISNPLSLPGGQDPDHLDVPHELIGTAFLTSSPPRIDYEEMDKIGAHISPMSSRSSSRRDSRRSSVTSSINGSPSKLSSLVGMPGDAGHLAHSPRVVSRRTGLSRTRSRTHSRTHSRSNSPLKKAATAGGRRPVPSSTARRNLNAPSTTLSSSLPSSSSAPRFSTRPGHEGGVRKVRTARSGPSSPLRTKTKDPRGPGFNF